MSDQPTSSATGRADSGIRRHPLGLASWHWILIVILAGLLGYGLLVSFLEAAGDSSFGDIVWIVGYGTGVFLVWYIWLRPLDIVGSTEQDRSTSKDESKNGEGSLPYERDISALPKSSQDPLSGTTGRQEITSPPVTENEKTE